MKLKCEPHHAKISLYVIVAVIPKEDLASTNQPRFLSLLSQYFSKREGFVAFFGKFQFTMVNVNSFKV